MHCTQLYQTGNAAAGWQKFCDKHQESDHTWVTKKALLQGHIALIKHWTNQVFHKIKNAKRGPNQSVAAFGAFITSI